MAGHSVMTTEPSKAKAADGHAAMLHDVYSQRAAAPRRRCVVDSRKISPMATSRCLKDCIADSSASIQISSAERAYSAAESDDSLISLSDFAFSIEIDIMPPSPEPGNYGQYDDERDPGLARPAREVQNFPVTFNYL